MHCLYFGTSQHKIYPDLAHFTDPFNGFGGKIATQLPKKIVLIRTVAMRILTFFLFVNLRATVWVWPIAITGIAYIGWIFYAHIWRKDPLIDALEIIAGGKDKLTALPTINLNQARDEKICQALARIKWEALKAPMSQSKTLDGRFITIIKGKNRDDQKANRIFAFIKQVGPSDLAKENSKLSAIAESILHAIFAPHQGNNFGSILSTTQLLKNNRREKVDIQICSSISHEMAKDFFRQMRKPIGKGC